MSAAETIFALSSGAPPAAISIVRVSGPQAGDVAVAVAGGLPEPRRAELRRLRRPADGDSIDRGLVLRFPAGGSVTGEELVEFHLHGSRAVVARMLSVLAEQPGCRPAQPGEFSRRALLNGKLGLVEAEALSDLLLAETEQERRAAQAMFDGALGDVLARWRRELIALSAAAEALIDLDGEADVADRGEADLSDRVRSLADEMRQMASGRGMESLRDGTLVVIAGPPNSGKSSLLNYLAGREASLVTPVAGTTRDTIEVGMDLGGVRVRLVDTAGLHATEDEVERLGIERARSMIAAATVILWLGDDAPETPTDAQVILVQSMCDRPDCLPAPDRLSISSMTGEGMERLMAAIADLVRLGAADGLGLNARQRHAAGSMAEELMLAAGSDDPLVVADQLRVTRDILNELVGHTTSDEVMDQLFSSFCVGK